MVHYKNRSISDSFLIQFFSFRVGTSRFLLDVQLLYSKAKNERKMSLQQTSHQRVFLVTGANKGIGFEVVRKLAVNHPTDLILLGSRDQKRGEEARAQLGSPSNVKVLTLDTSSNKSIERAKQEIEKKYGGHLDVLINNAAIYNRETGIKVLKDIFNTNFYGVKQMNDAMSPLLRDSGRIVNVSSGLGATAMKHCSRALKAKFLDPNLTETQLQQLFEP